MRDDGTVDGYTVLETLGDKIGEVDGGVDTDGREDCA